MGFGAHLGEGSSISGHAGSTCFPGLWFGVGVNVTVFVEALCSSQQTMRLPEAGHLSVVPLVFEGLACLGTC